MNLQQKSIIKKRIRQVIGITCFMLLFLLLGTKGLYDYYFSSSKQDSNTLILLWIVVVFSSIVIGLLLHTISIHLKELKEGKILTIKVELVKKSKSLNNSNTWKHFFETKIIENKAEYQDI